MACLGGGPLFCYPAHTGSVLEVSGSIVAVHHCSVRPDFASSYNTNSCAHVVYIGHTTSWWHAFWTLLGEVVSVVDSLLLMPIGP